MISEQQLVRMRNKWSTHLGPRAVNKNLIFLNANFMSNVVNLPDFAYPLCRWQWFYVELEPGHNVLMFNEHK